ncbi:MAG: deoxyribodipyrimidine photolyase [Gemmataceae bacterium]|nr:deoxyribodipyrimidine photolyase [Gemmataceae bacterium]MDW8267253.1 deoxyribodipyrimidine photolyase [Gemmataceae bacterium]
MLSAASPARVRHVSGPQAPVAGDYVLYWMQIYRRLAHNHALDYALRWAVGLKKPLVVYEGLKLGYPWASRRLHRFILEGMQTNAGQAREIGLNYWPFVETPEQSGRGLLRRLAARACLVVTDDFPCFIIPDQTAALARQTPTPVVAIDSNGVVPLSLLGPPATAAAHLRPRIHRAFAAAWSERAVAEPVFPRPVRRTVEPPFPLWDPGQDLTTFIDGLPIDPGVRPVATTPGGSRAARRRLAEFVSRKLPGYAEGRSHPLPPEQGHASGLSPYLHFGHISIEEVVATVLASVGWSPQQLDERCVGRREGFWSANADVNAFLDEAIVWRDLGFHWHWHRRSDTTSLERALPAWAWTTLRKHAADPRDYCYRLEQWEAAETHDPLWNAAQIELVHAGTIHNYLRMLWGKKVIEWSATPEEAYRILEHLNNKYALDGRNPNSYTGILWCFGLFDRPWAPERKVFGTVRYMSSENTARKFRLEAYLAYVRSLADRPAATG